MFAHSPPLQLCEEEPPRPFMDVPGAGESQPAFSSTFERLLSQPGGAPATPQPDAKASPWQPSILENGLPLSEALGY
jgi:hypothetical protein